MKRKGTIIINSGSKVLYQTHEDICRIYGIKFCPRKATVRFNAYITFWFPAITNKGVKDKNWKNILSKDENTIEMSSINGSISKKINKKSLIVTFGKIKIKNKIYYKFIGIYIEKDSKKNIKYFIKVADQFSAEM